jgi:uncharacterized protein YgiM (DUF1202 family)
MKHNLWICFCVAAALSVAAEESATVNRNHVNVRGAPTLNSEVVTHLQKGDKVTFLEEIPVEKPKPGEPARWAAIKLPADAHVWVFTGFLNDKTVKVNKLNLRAGPGENFSVLGRLEKGAQVKEIRTTDQWMEIEPPETTRAYLDASYLDRGPVEAGKDIAAVETPKPIVVFEPPAKSAPTVVKPEPPVFNEPAKPLETPKAVETPKPVETVVKQEPAATPVKEDKPAVAAKPEEAPAKPAVETPATPPPDVPARVLPPVAPVVAESGAVPANLKRVVRREGEVRSTKFNIQAPTYFELIGEKGRVLNYLSAEKAGLKLKDYKGLRVIVTGEEAIDPRYPERPLIEVETIEVAP